MGELYRHAEDFRDWERFFEAVTEEEIEESAPFFEVQSSLKSLSEYDSSFESAG